MTRAWSGSNLKHRERGQSTVELAFATLILAVLVVGMVGVTESMQAQIGLTAVAEEAAHAAALAPSAGSSQQRGRDRGIAVGKGYALRNGSLNVDIQYGAFEAGQQIRAVATYQLTTRDIPLLVAATVNVRREHVKLSRVFVLCLPRTTEGRRTMSTPLFAVLMIMLLGLSGLAMDGGELFSLAETRSRSPTRQHVLAPRSSTRSSCKPTLTTPRKSIP